MPANTVREPVAKVTGIYRGKFSGLEPLTIDKPLSMEEVRRNPIFYELDLNPETGDENLIIDLIYDNMAPIRLQDLYRGTDLPRGVRVLAGLVRHPAVRRDAGRGRPPGISPCAGLSHRADPDGVRKRARMGGNRDFSPEMGGFSSPVFEFMIAGDGHV